MVRTRALTVGEGEVECPGSMPGLGTKMPQVVQHGQKKKKSDNNLSIQQ